MTQKRGWFNNRFTNSRRAAFSNAAVQSEIGVRERLFRAQKCKLNSIGNLNYPKIHIAKRKNHAEFSLGVSS